MRGMPWHTGKAGGISGSIVPARAASADEGNRIHGGAGLLDREARCAAVGNVCERTVGYGRKAVEGGCVHQEDQVAAAKGQRGAGREEEGLKRSGPKRKSGPHRLKDRKHWSLTGKDLRRPEMGIGSPCFSPR